MRDGALQTLSSASEGAEAHASAGDEVGMNEFTISHEEYVARRHQTQLAMADEELDAVIAYSTAKAQANVRWLTSYYVRFTGMQTRPDGSYYMFGATACLVSADDAEPVVRTDQPWDVARCKDMSVYPDADGSDDLGAELGPIIAKRGFKRVGIDNWYLFPAKDYMALQNAAPNTEFVPTHLMSHVRRVKSATEQAIMRRAAQVAVAATTKALDAVEVGGSEYEIQLICEYEMRSAGDLHPSGESIGGCGPHTATGSYVPSRYRDRKMQAGEWVMLDVVPRVEGYCSDIGRHRLVGDPSDLDPKLRHMMDTTILMNEEVRKAVKPGITGRQLNELATKIATQEGLAEIKIALLGHGVGIDVHDIPDYYFDDNPLREGEVITVEPCLILPNVAGTRIEDTVLVTADGSETLTESPRCIDPS